MASGIWHLACQTYALNLFQFHCILNQTQFLFSSPRSFRVAKSATLSARLPPIFKLLSKFSLLSKSALFFMTLLLLSYTQDSVALTAYTSRTIEGTPPYLTFDGGRTKATNTDGLLSIKLQDGRVITPSTNTSSATNPIRLPYVGSTLAHIEVLVPSGVNSVSFNDLITQGNWGDDDGDGQGTNGITATGILSASFLDKDGYTVSRSAALDVCKAPYKVVLRSTGGSLKTQYGLPNTSYFSGQVVTYYINPYDGSRVCYFVQSARPNLYFGGTGATIRGNYDYSKYAGPSNIWSSRKGFLTQSTSPSSYGLNFPTTGADGLYFDLELPIGVDGSQLTWSVVTNGSINATVSWTRPRSSTFRDPNGNQVNADEWIRDKSSYVTRVTLNGPWADSGQIQSDNPTPLSVPSLPQTFELVGRDSGNEVRYGFVLRQWFVGRGGHRINFSNQLSWCSSLGYRMPRIRNLTNAIASPGGNNNYYRSIGAGLYSEWGLMSNYQNVNFSLYMSWTDDVTNTDVRAVYPFDGGIWEKSKTIGIFGLCVTP
ncbi:hypothetical protein [Gilliamella sp. Pas-s95]|uniref:hypothetical protein n=1 Tax=Gilliamella sp. Pas-s95 TaxID=2687317 RepID=UPI001324F4E5|nr:hypothetical protein [Gilliamella sp. Pas-s95]MWN05862.1 hypothetical protein [Gilliamella sp. Pas-s95]